MSDQLIWMVRAGRGAEFFDEFLEDGVVAIGWNETMELPITATKEAIAKCIAAANPNESKGSIGVWAAQVKRFLSEINVGDSVTTYDPAQRLYLLGRITSGPERREHVLGTMRRVTWERQVPRDSLTSSTRNALGSIATLFTIKKAAAADMMAKAVAIGSAEQASVSVAEKQADDSEDRIYMAEVAAKAKEYLEDRIARLEWHQLQQLVAEILTAMGFKARVSPAGADRGVDVFASPDGLGLQEPRIFVEVKHRPGTQISADQIRSFLGGRQSTDRCLYVSTGGFTKDSRYEAERASVPLTLITLPQLRELLVEFYDRLSPTGAALVPMERVYWPVV